MVRSGLIAVRNVIAKERVPGTHDVRRGGPALFVSYIRLSIDRILDLFCGACVGAHAGGSGSYRYDFIHLPKFHTLVLAGWRRFGRGLIDAPGFNAETIKLPQSGAVDLSWSR